MTTIVNTGTVTNTETLQAGDYLYNSGSGTIAPAAGEAVYGSGGASTVTNIGTITGGNADGIVLQAGGTVTNGSSTDPSASISGSDAGVAIYGGPASVTNCGDIGTTGGFDFGDFNVPAGIILDDGGTVTNAAGGNISGYRYGIQALSGATTVVNDGVLSGGINGLVLRGGGEVVNGTSGAIETGLTAFDAPVTVFNYGAIVGGEGSVALFAGGTLVNGAGGATNAVVGTVRVNDPGTVINYATIGGYVNLYGGGYVRNGSAGSTAAHMQQVFAEGPTTIVNDGTMANAGRASNYGPVGSAIELLGGGSVTNGAPDATGALISGYAFGIQGSVDVTNYGTIQATAQVLSYNYFGSRATGIGIESNGGSVINGSSADTTALIRGYNFGIENVGSGAVTNYGTIAGGVDGVVLGAGSSLINDGTITGATGVSVGSGSTIINDGVIAGTGGTAISLSTGDTLVLGAGSQIDGGITGFGPTDTLDLTGVAITSASFANGVLSLNGGAETLQFSTLPAGYGFTYGPDGAGGTDVTQTPADLWTGGSGDWSNAGYWSSGVPTPISAWEVSQPGITVTIAAGESYSALSGIIDGAGAVLDVAGTLSMGGALTIEAGTVVNSGVLDPTVSVANGAYLDNQAGATIVGSASLDVPGSTGGDGVDLAAGGSLVNDGAITGGAGRGTGGAGVSLVSGASFTNDGVIAGGNGVGGGAGVQILYSGVLSYGDVTNSGTIIGGAPHGGEGGMGVLFDAPGTLINEAGGFIDGYAGVGTESYFVTVINYGTITGNIPVAFHGGGHDTFVVEGGSTMIGGGAYGGGAVLDFAGNAGPGTITNIYGYFSRINVEAGTTWTNDGAFSGNGSMFVYGTLVNKSGFGSGVTVTAGAYFDNTAAGSISANPGGGGSFENIQPGGPGGVGVSVAPGGSAVNDGFISGGAGGRAYYGAPAGAGGAGVAQSGGSFVNRGAIAGGQGGVGIFAPSGVGGAGVALSGGSFVNLGTISGGPGNSFYGPRSAMGLGASATGGALTNGAVGDNAALIEGSIGLAAYGPGATVVNYGTIASLYGPGGTAVSLEAGDTLMIEAGSTLIGSVEGGGGTLVLGSAGGPGTVIGQYSGFAQIYVGAGADWANQGTLGGAVSIAAGGFLYNQTSGQIAGSAGVSASGPGGGVGGDGVDLAAGGSLVNAGTVTAGAGASYYYSFPDADPYVPFGHAHRGAIGGTGLNMASGASLTNAGTIEGGTGGSSGSGYGDGIGYGFFFRTPAGAGGAGVSLAAAASLTNNGTINGGTGGNGGPGYLAAASGGAGGIGAVVAGGELINSDAITGGAGGVGGQVFGFGGNYQGGQGGAGGAGAVLSDGGSLVNLGTVAGGTGGAGGYGNYGSNNPGSSGTAGDGVVLSGSGAVTNGHGALIEGNVGVDASGAGATVTNYGIIDGTGGTAVDFTGGGDTLVVAAGSALIGSAQGGGGSLFFSGAAGPGTATGQYDGFSTITIDAAADWTNDTTLDGDVTVATGGYLDNTASGVIAGNAGAPGNFAGNGGTGVYLAQFASLTNSGSIAGGAGGNGYLSGVGGTGVSVDGGELTNNAAITGGYGGGPGAAGGVGVALSGGSVLNQGMVAGGTGAVGGPVTYSVYGYTFVTYRNGSDGGAGADLTGGNFDNLGTIAGGNGGNGPFTLDVPVGGGTGGVGVELFGGSLVNQALVEGGSGGLGGLALYAGVGPAGAGGAGILLFGPAAITNLGTITGAGTAPGIEATLGSGLITNGSAGDQSALITGGIGVELASNTTVTNYGTIANFYDAGGIAVALSGPSDRLVVESGSTLVGVALGNGATLAFGAAGGSGTITGLGSEYSGFSQYVVDSGADWTLAGNNTVAGGATLTNEGSLTGAATLAPGAYLDNTASGTTTDLRLAVYGGAATIANAGTMSDTGGADAVYQYGSGTLDVVVDPGAAFVGDVVAQTDGMLELTAGTGGTLSVNGDNIYALDTVFENFTTLDIDSGADWTLAKGSSIGNGVSLNITGTFVNDGTITGATGLDVSADGATIVNYGTIAGSGGTAVDFTGSGDTLVVEGGSTLVGAALGGGGTLDFGAGAGPGTTTGLGSQYSGFSQYAVLTGADWTLTGANTIASGATLTDAGTLTVTGSLGGTGTTPATTVAGGGAEVVAAGGSVSGTDVQAGGVQTVEAGGTAQGTILEAPTPIVYDPAATFARGWTAQTNPNGVWSYGYSQGAFGAVTLFDQAAQDAALDDVWQSSTVSVTTSGFTEPSIALNNDATHESFVDLNGVSTLIPLTLGSGPGTGGYTSDLIFTAPSAGTYTVEGAFVAAHIAAGISVGGNLDFIALPFGNAVVPFDLTVNLTAGEQVEFSAGSTFGAPSTGLIATITQVPTSGGGSEDVYGSTSDTQIDAGAVETVEAGGADTGATIAGVQDVFGSASGATVLSDGLQQIESGGVAAATTVDSGGSVANDGTVQATAGGDAIQALDGGAAITNAAGGTIVGNTGVYALGAGTTVTNYGSIQGTGGPAVVFGGSGNTLAVEAGSTLVGGAQGGGGTLDLAAGAGPGTLTGLSSQYSGFSQYNVLAGADWNLAGANSLVGSSFIDGAGTLANLGTLTAATSGGTFIGNTDFTNDGSVAVSNGDDLTFATAVGTDSGDNGTISVAGGGIVGFEDGVAAAQTLSFDDGTGLADLDDPAGFAATIDGFQSGDTIDLVDTSVTQLSLTGDQLTASGAGGTVAALNFAGSFAGFEFTAASDGNGGTDLLLAANPTATAQSYATAENTELDEPAAGGLLVGATGDNLVANLATGPAEGSVVVNTDGSFSYTPDADFYGTDSFSYTASDSQGTGTSAPATVTISVADTATVTESGVAGGFSGNENSAISLAGITVSDSNTGDPSLTTTLSVADGAITVGTTSNGAVAGGNGTGSVTLTGTAAQIDASLQNASYQGDADFYGNDTLSVTSTDGGGQTSGTAQGTITVNDVTTPSEAVGGPYTVNENGSVALNLSVSANPNASDPLTTVISVANGTISVGAGAAVTGTGTGSVTLTGTAAQIDAALAGANYSGASDFYGTDTLSMTTTDTVDHQSTGAQTAGITVNDVTTPSEAVGGPYTVNENAPVALNLSVSASPNASDPLSTVLSVANGTISVGAGAAVTGNGTGSVTLAGTAAQIDAALAGASYTGGNNYSGPDTLAMVTTDTVDQAQVSGSASVTVANPTLPGETLGGPYTGNENTAIGLTGLTVSETANGSDPLSTVLSVAHGTITVGSAGGATILGNGSGTVTVSGSIAQINAALAGAQYTGATNFYGADTLSMTTTDTTDGKTTGAETAGITVNDTTLPSETVPTLTIGKNAPASLGGISVSASPDAGDPLQITVQAPSGSLSYNGSPVGQSFSLSGTAATIDADLAHLAFTPANGATGTVDLTVTTTDTADAKTVSKTLAVTIDPGPTAHAGSDTVGHNQAVNLTSTILGFVTPGVPGDTETISALSALHGQTGLVNGVATYTSPASGSDTLSFTVKDQLGDSASGTVAITVDPGPKATAGSVTVAAGQSIDLTATLLGFATPGLSGDTLTLTGDNVTGTKGTVSLSHGDLTYLAPSATGTDSFGYTVSDEFGDTASSTITVNVMSSGGNLGNGSGTFVVGNTSGPVGFQNGNVNLIAGNGNDQITGGGGNDTVAAGNGNDTVSLQNGTDSVTLGTGSSTVTVGGGSPDTVTIAGSATSFNTVTTGNGSDTVTIGAGGGKVNVGGGNDTVSIGGSPTSNSTVTTGNGADSVNVAAGAFTINVGGGKDTVTVGDGSGTITTGNGNDTFVAGNGNVTFNLGGGNNSVTGGNGNDSVTLQNGTNTITLGDGSDAISVGGGTNTISVGNGKGTITVNGNGANTITAGNGNDTLALGGGNNHVTLGSGNDTVTSTGNPNEWMLLGTGTDTITVGGGASTFTLTGGQDTINTGNGANEFIFTLPKGELMTQGNTSEKFVFSNTGFDLGVDDGKGTATPQQIAASLFSTSTNGTFTAAGQRFAYNQSNGNLYYDAQGNQAGSTSVLVAHLTGEPHLTATNLLFTS